MKAKYGLFLILMLAVMITVSALPCRAQGTSEEKEAEKKEDIWTQEGPPGPGGRGGPGRGGPRRGPRFELKDEEIVRIIKSIKEDKPEKAEELEKMREEISQIIKSIKESDPDKAKELEKTRREKSRKLQEQLREHGREEFDKIFSERIDKWMEQRREEFLKWLDKNFHREAEELKKIQDPDLYIQKYDLLRKKYWGIFEVERRNPELGEVLKEKIRVEDWRDRLLSQIRRTKNEKKNKELINKLREALSRWFDLRVKEKKIGYKWLRERLEDLKRRMEERQAEIAKLEDQTVKKQEVEERLRVLLEQNKKH
ncbi:MAG: hypothetical protein GWN67_09235 [Phycisphaerae bacterium]|nr:hypothetical protein [Phycisphaerae bacterium]NIP50481.1 hypothetical protein [Phycisphaerae bacterium]NIS51261.1 hypothetical protein [Phycisphaerae bacterium]NIU07368.1 hypothetical protein [Phycisphaerae bacterium]NIU56548.1 hypothetical protein [Phycisphaerae bacterium]